MGNLNIFFIIIKKEDIELSALVVIILGLISYPKKTYMKPDDSLPCFPYCLFLLKIFISLPR